MPVRVYNRLLRRGAAAMVASMLLFGGCTAAGAAGVATDALQEGLTAENAVVLEESSAAKTYNGNIAFLWVVNQEYSLPGTYEPADLTEAGNGQRLSAEAAESFLSMQRSMNIDGAGKLILEQGYRSWKEQEQMVTERAAYYKEQGYDSTKAETFAKYDCGVPGSDPYQTGLAARVAPEASEWGETGEWLAQHASEFGFVLSMDENTAQLRYVGELHAAAVKRLGVDVEGYIEYLDTYGQYVFEFDGSTYKVELVRSLDGIQESFVSICGDNRGNYILLKQEG